MSRVTRVPKRRSRRSKRPGKPDLVLLDIAMTPVDGLQCLKAIRARPGYGRIPAIALTAYARDVERQAFLTGGFQAVVTKPILDHQDLFEAIDALLVSEPVPTCSPSADDSGSDQSALSHPPRMAPAFDSHPLDDSMISKLWVRFPRHARVARGEPSAICSMPTRRRLSYPRRTGSGSSSPLGRAISVRFMRCSNACIERCLP